MAKSVRVRIPVYRASRATGRIRKIGTKTKTVRVK